MNAPWIPGFEYPATGGTVLTMTLSQREWEERQIVTGGRRESAVFVVASRTIARKNVLEMILRVRDSERPNVRAMIEYMQDHPNTPATVWPDTDEEDSYAFLLVNPVQGEEIKFNKTDVHGVREIALTIRKPDSSPWDLEYFPEP